MARTPWPCCPAYLFISAHCGLILFAALPNGLLALGTFQAGMAAPFSPLQETSFWTSADGNYTFGFQAVNGGRADYLLSIWLSADPHKTAIWWPSAQSPVNHDDDLTVNESAIFQFTIQGSLELLYSPNGSLLWSTNTTSSYATFNDTGNLVLIDEGSISWQSFEDCRDSLMLDGLQNINISNKPSLLQSRRDQSSHVAGRFRLETAGNEKVRLHGDYAGDDFVYAEAEMNTTGSFMIGMTQENVYKNQDTPIDVRRLTLDHDGNLKIYHWQSNNSTWTTAWQILDKQCRLGSPCGPFGICHGVDQDGKPNCSCPNGFPQKGGADDPSQGCENSITESFIEACTNSTAISIEEVDDADYYLNDLYSKDKVDTKEHCKKICSENCTCMAAVYSEAMATCFVKGKKGAAPAFLMNGYHLSGATLYIKFNTTLSIKVKDTPKDTPKRPVHWPMWLATSAAVLIAVCFGAFLIWQRRNHACLVFQPGRPKHEYAEVAGDVGPIRFYRHDELVLATSNFSEPLGKGGFGTVFKGWLAMDNPVFDNSDSLGSNIVYTSRQMCAVAVKVLRGFEGKRHMESYSQFKAEINTVGKIHHVNLVSLLGFSYSTDTPRELNENARMLVFECMENGSLDRYLSASGQHTKPKLAWHTRYSIALGIARGMAYLHHDCSPPILHCDIKPHNILLDANFVAKVADFGFARRINPHGHIILSSVHGTHGYLAPEWLTNGELTFKVDVYSFGKLLLELVRGFKLAGGDGLTMPLVEWAIECMSYGAVVEFSGWDEDEDVSEYHPLQDDKDQKRQQEENDKLRLLKVGLWCIQQKAEVRPSMSRVVQLIEGNISVEDPPMPAIVPPFSSKQSFSARTYHGESMSAR